MAVLRPRRRLVFFRIPEDDYERFRGLCEQEGARSVSELARTAVDRLISRQDSIEERMGVMCGNLEKVLNDLMEIVRETKSGGETRPLSEPQ